MEKVISSIAFGKQPLETTIQWIKQRKLALEFSSGLPYMSNVLDVFYNADIAKYAHNYFPAPKEPFVLNLASSNDTIRERSIAHCLQGLRISAKVNAPFFSAHAGFCIDPPPNQLGKKIDIPKISNREMHYDLFLESLTVILTEAKKLNLKFLIENNVLAKMNYPNNSQNPLLGVESFELVNLANHFGLNHFGLLLDTAHLKVSAGTLNFDLNNSVMDLKDYIFCIHHSDNNGMQDDNSILPEDYWFLKHMNHFKNIPHVLEVKNIDSAIISSQLELLK